MSSRKRPTSSATRGRPKRGQPIPPTSTATTGPPSTSVNMEALTASITAAVTSAALAAMQTQDPPTSETPASASESIAVSVEAAVSDQLALITSPTAGTPKPDSSGASSSLENSKKLVFSSLALQLGGGVTEKIKAKVWANEYVDFCLLLSVALSPDCYSISINTSTPSLGASSPLNRQSL